MLGTDNIIMTRTIPFKVKMYMNSNTCGKLLHDHITLLRREIWAHQASFYQ